MGSMTERVIKRYGLETYIRHMGSRGRINIFLQNFGISTHYYQEKKCEIRIIGIFCRWTDMYGRAVEFRKTHIRYRRARASIDV